MRNRSRDLRDPAQAQRLQHILDAQTALMSEVTELRQRVTVLEGGDKVPPLLPDGTYLCTWLDVDLREGRLHKYWNFEMRVDDMPEKKLWYNLVERWKWPVVRLIEQFGVPVADVSTEALDRDLHALVGNKVRCEVTSSSYGGRTVNTVTDMKSADMRRP
jgi:hypothetical protein